MTELAAIVLGSALIAIVLWDAFETVLLPRTVTRRLRLARVYFRGTWSLYAAMARQFETEKGRERFLAVYGPISLVGLLIVWAVALVIGFAGLQWADGSRLVVASSQPARFADDLYMSGTTFFTLGLGDVHPVDDPIARLLTVIESGMGFGFLALVFAYFPVLYQSFSRREVRLTLLDAWAGSPPSGAEVLRRLGEAGEVRALDPFLRDWEYWCSELLESHLSYPVVAYFRSQHQRQSWVSALAAILDLSALVVVGIDGLSPWQAHLTFAIARHATVDLAQIFRIDADPLADRLTDLDLEGLRRQLEAVGLRPNRSPDADARLRDLRRSYEPFLVALGRTLLMPVPPWVRTTPRKDNWQTSPKSEGGTHL
jgi:ion channel